MDTSHPPVEPQRSSSAAAHLPAYRPQLATLVKEPPASEAWLHEIKLDGYRLGCRLAGATATLITRSGRDWTREFPEIRDAALSLAAREALLDGEVVVLDPNGRARFQALQDALAGGPREGLVYVVFDLLFLDGELLTHEPVEVRKAKLEALLARGGGHDPRLHYSRHWIGGGPLLFREACRLGAEGIVSKRRDAPYETGRRPTWVKAKCWLRQEFVIGGFTDAEDAPTTRIGALLLGVRDGDQLTFAGKVGTGFTHRLSEELHRRLSAMGQRDCPFTPRPAGWLGRHAHWVRPELLAEVAFAEWTRDGIIRHASFQGLREDKLAAEAVREVPAEVPEEPSGTPPPDRARSRSPGRKRGARRRS